MNCLVFYKDDVRFQQNVGVLYHNRNKFSEVFVTMPASNVFGRYVRIMHGGETLGIGTDNKEMRVSLEDVVCVQARLR